MEANELRIGNILYFPITTEYVKVLGINAHEKFGTIYNTVSFKKDLNLYCESIHTLHPVLINEEWLLKFGFKKIIIDCDGFVGTDYELVDKDFILSYSDDFSISILGEREDFGIAPPLKNFKYVHQLQNLYYLLTQKEL